MSFMIARPACILHSIPSMAIVFYYPNPNPKRRLCCHIHSTKFHSTLSKPIQCTNRLRRAVNPKASQFIKSNSLCYTTHVSYPLISCESLSCHDRSSSKNDPIDYFHLSRYKDPAGSHAVMLHCFRQRPWSKPSAPWLSGQQQPS